MKKLLFITALFFITISFAQDKAIKGETNFEYTKFTNVAIKITVDSAQEIKDTFTLEDIEEMLDDTKSGEGVSFKITCNSVAMPNGSKSHIAYSVDGNTDNKAEFLETIAKVREAAINYYTNKN